MEAIAQRILFTWISLGAQTDEIRWGALWGAVVGPNEAGPNPFAVPGFDPHN